LRFDVIAADADLREREGTLIEQMIMICYDQSESVITNPFNQRAFL
jgi:hypothetical protein